MRQALVIIIAGATIGISACTSQIGHLTLMTADNVDGMPDPVARSVEGRHCQIQWTMDLQPTLQKAMSRALEQAGRGNALANVTVYLQRQTWILFNRNCLEVEGDVVELDRVMGTD